MRDNATLLVHLDYGGGEHAYILYQVDRDKLDRAREAAAKAWEDYEAADRNGCWEDFLEAALGEAGIKFRILDYEPLSILA